MAVRSRGIVSGASSPSSGCPTGCKSVSHVCLLRSVWGLVLGEVDFMVEEGGLRGCGGHYGDLIMISIRML